jgi:hypothetical protein
MRQMFAVLLGAVAIALAVSAQPASARPEYTRKTSKDCSYCHQPPGYNLNDAGRYYADHNHSLKGFTPPPKPKPSH